MSSSVHYLIFTFPYVFSDAVATTYLDDIRYRILNIQ